ncbi:MAG: carbohydrate kinase family protein [Candidatus Saccharibacteria bacterium]
MPKTIGVLGSSNIDIYVLSKLFKINYNVVLKQGVNTAIESIVQEPGGDGLLTSVLYARQQEDVTLFTKTGSDMPANFIEMVCNEESISLATNFKTTKYHTDSTIHLMNISKNDTTLSSYECFDNISKNDINELISKSKWVHLANIPKSKPILYYALKNLISSNVELVVSLVYPISLPKRAVSKLLKQAKLVVISRAVAIKLLSDESSSEQLALELHSKGARHIVIYDTSGDTVCINDGLVFRAQKYTPKHISDIGGVDAIFAAGYIYSFMKYGDAKKAINFGLSQAKSVMSVIGSRSAILRNPVLEKIKISEHNLMEVSNEER